jgi:hypothetical protein
MEIALSTKELQPDIQIKNTQQNERTRKNIPDLPPTRGLYPNHSLLRKSEPAEIHVIRVSKSTTTEEVIEEERIEVMVILSTTYENRAFDSLTLAEIYGCENIIDNCCILTEDGRVLAFKRKGGDNVFTRIRKQDRIETPA